MRIGYEKDYINRWWYSHYVTPNIALLPSLKEAGYEVFYIGSYTGIEKTLIENLDIPYYGISSGKLRRYKSFKNLTDPFRVIKGYFQARRLMRRIKPDIIFSKGGLYLFQLYLQLDTSTFLLSYTNQI